MEQGGVDPSDTSVTRILFPFTLTFPQSCTSKTSLTSKSPLGLPPPPKKNCSAHSVGVAALAGRAGLGFFSVEQECPNLEGRRAASFL